MNTMLSFKTISRGALTLLGALAIVCILLVSRTPTAAAGETVGRYTSDDPSLVSGISGRVHHVTRPIALRGLYVPLVAANNRQRLDRIFWLMKYREPNAAVLDVKDVPGVTYHSNVALAQRVSGNRRFMIDVHGLIQQFHDRRIYVICRMVAFYDPNLARARPGWAIHKSDGSNWKDAHGGGWLSPYANGARAHLIAIAEEAASNGCDELQLDYTLTL